MTIVVDPYLISIPYGNVQDQQVRDYASRLTTWDQTFRLQPDYVVSSKAMEMMYHLGLEPSMTNLQVLLERYGIEELAAYDIAIGCERLITNYPQMEDRAVAFDIESIEGSESVIPAQIRERMHPEIAKSFVDALVTTSYALNILEDDSVWNMATAPMEFENSISEMVIEGRSQDRSSIENVTRNWPLIFSPDQFVDTERVSDIFDFNPIRATELAWANIKAQRVEFPIVSDRFRFGNRFLRSLKTPGFQKRPDVERDLERVFEAIVNVLTRTWVYPSDKHHPLREDIKDRTSKQQTRRVQIKTGGFVTERAGRVEVFGGKNCLHLHYWQCHDGSYEFSNITIEHDDSIIYY